MLLTLNIPFLTFLITISAQEIFNIDKSNWIDPSDMLYYDEAKKAMIKEDEKKHNEQNEYINPSTEEVQSPDENSSYNSAEFLKIRTMLNGCQAEVSSCKLQKNGISGIPYMKRFVGQLLRLFQKSENQDEEITLQLKLSYENRKMLNNFVDSDEDVQLSNVDEVLSKMFDESGLYHDYSFSMFYTSDISQIITLGLILSFTVYVFWTLSLRKVLIAGFVISVFWRWQHMYKEAVAKQHAEIFKFNDMPKECSPADLSWFDSLKYWWDNRMLNVEDKCVAYYKHLEVDPFWDVSPSDAFIDTIFRMILHPVGMIGTELGKFFNNLYQNSPVFVFWYIVPMLMVLIVIMVLTNSGYDFNFLFGALSISKKSEMISAPTNKPSLMDRIQEIAPESLRNEHKAPQLIINPNETLAVGDEKYIEPTKEKIMEKQISSCECNSDDEMLKK